VSNNRKRQLALKFPAQRRCTLASFEAGPNRELVEALTAVGQSNRFTALWLAGDAGAGKSHLLQGACHSAVAAGVTAAYLPQDVRAAGPQVLEGLGEFGVVAIDDFDRWIGERVWEEALLGLYQQLFDRRGTLLLACARAPADLDIGLADLASRARAAHVFRLRPLEDADRARAIERLAAQRGLELGADVSAFILRRVPRRMDELLAVFERLDRGALAQQRRLTIPLVKELLSL
jgi:DnaA-homolog protein